MPLHKGHLALFEFAGKQCDTLHILLCHTNNELIPGAVREEWLKDMECKSANVRVISFAYSEDDLVNTSVSSRKVSLKWSEAIKNILPDIDLVFSSELYGDYLAEFMNCQHIVFDIERKSTAISASAIISNPLLYWNYIAEVAKPYFVKKIVLLGTESTGKSTLTRRLAEYFGTGYVPEMARDVLEKTTECKPHHLIEIAELHAKEILKKVKKANRLLFIDTDINITASYSEYLFNQHLPVGGWIEEANKSDLYIFLEPDCEFVQDGTRLTESERNKLSLFHKEQLHKKGIAYFSVYGNWEERFKQSCSIVKKELNLNNS